MRGHFDHMLLAKIGQQPGRKFRPMESLIVRGDLLMERFMVEERSL